jgi:hypothetical protein
MTKKKYKLIYQDIEVGTIHQTQPPTPFGIFELTNQQLPQYLFDFIEYSFECDELFEKDEEKWLKYIEKNEHYHLDIIESDDWYLSDEVGNMIKILVPIVGKDNINWRLD